MLSFPPGIKLELYEDHNINKNYKKNIPNANSVSPT